MLLKIISIDGGDMRVRFSDGIDAQKAALALERDARRQRQQEIDEINRKQWIVLSPLQGAYSRVRSGKFESLEKDIAKSKQLLDAHFPDLPEGPYYYIRRGLLAKIEYCETTLEISRANSTCSRNYGSLARFNLEPQDFSLSRLIAVK